MIKNFEEVKKQLAELSEVVNKFKSEAVQLRIVELVFAGGGTLPTEEVDAKEADDTPAAPRRKRARKQRTASTNASSAKTENKSKKSRPTGQGPKPTLEEFISEGFFNQKRTIRAVVEHCKLKARSFKANELSGPLGRLVRENKLTRTTNGDNQFEYIKK